MPTRSNETHESKSFEQNADYGRFTSMKMLVVATLCSKLHEVCGSAFPFKATRFIRVDQWERLSMRVCATQSAKGPKRGSKARRPCPPYQSFCNQDMEALKWIKCGLMSFVPTLESNSTGSREPQRFQAQVRYRPHGREATKRYRQKVTRKQSRERLLLRHFQAARGILPVVSTRRQQQ